MHLYSLICAIFCIFALECHGQQYTFREDPVLPYCGGRGSNQVDVRGNRNQRREAERIIAAFKGDYFACKERAGTLIKNENVRIDLQDAAGGFERDGKRWRNLQLQKNGPRTEGYPSTVATVLIECNKPFPIRLVRKAFVDSMTKCAMIWLSQ
ncbi:uncharacterized protein LOC116923221 [Daphnia magna]|uniref:uncharacterized protein LOC116923221 n=1 Tax=Daphnia magna TaxID=35525 RepID=UPI001E1BBECE|nr:uncharacterized protein LOC116923221 [Daphnia magna]